MELTPRALALKESLPDALERVRSLLASESFDPATSARRFVVVMHDHLARPHRARPHRARPRPADA